jgi:hypothetical protein
MQLPCNRILALLNPDQKTELNGAAAEEAAA